MVCDPGLHLVGIMPLKVIDDEKQFLRPVVNQLTQEAQESRDSEGTLIDHKPQFAAIGDHRNHGGRKIA